MMRRLGESDRLGLVLGRLGESAKVGEARYQPGAIVDRSGHGHSERPRNRTRWEGPQASRP